MRATTSAIRCSTSISPLEIFSAQLRVFVHLKVQPLDHRTLLRFGSLERSRGRRFCVRGVHPRLHAAMIGFCELAFDVGLGRRRGRGLARSGENRIPTARFDLGLRAGLRVRGVATARTDRVGQRRAAKLRSSRRWRLLRQRSEFRSEGKNVLARRGPRDRLGSLAFLSKYFAMGVAFIRSLLGGSIV